MDDQNFDQKTAWEWIRIVENPKGGLRKLDIYPRLKTWVEEVAPREILEIGAGQGVCSDQIDLTDRRYLGLEPSPYLVERARQLYQDESRQFVEGNAYRLPFFDGSFDAVFSVMVWHLLEDLSLAAAEMGRVLRAGGQFLVITANPEAYPAWREMYTEVREDGARFEGKLQLPDQMESYDVLYLHGLPEILGALRASRLEVEGTEAFREGQLLAIRGRWV